MTDEKSKKMVSELNILLSLQFDFTKFTDHQACVRHQTRCSEIQIYSYLGLVEMKNVGVFRQVTSGWVDVRTTKSRSN